MDIEIIKPHSAYPLGIVSVTDERGNYLIRMGVAIQPVTVVKTKTTKPKKKDE